MELAFLNCECYLGSIYENKICMFVCFDVGCKFSPC